MNTGSLSTKVENIDEASLNFIFNSRRINLKATKKKRTMEDRRRRTISNPRPFVHSVATYEAIRVSGVQSMRKDTRCSLPFLFSAPRCHQRWKRFLRHKGGTPRAFPSFYYFFPTPSHHSSKRQMEPHANVLNPFFLFYSFFFRLLLFIFFFFWSLHSFHFLYTFPWLRCLLKSFKDMNYSALVGMAVKEV